MNKHCLYYSALTLLLVCTWNLSANNLVLASDPAKTILESGHLDYKVGFLGNPSSSVPFEKTVPVPWTKESVGQLKKPGFNTVQINVAWGPRPADEVLNIEDLVQLSPEQERQLPQVVPLRGYEIAAVVRQAVLFCLIVSPSVVASSGTQRTHQSEKRQARAKFAVSGKKTRSATESSN